MRDGMPLVQLKNVDVVFEKRNGWFAGASRIKAVSGASLDIHAGEVVALVGESGCGKTTLGKLIVGLLEPDAGQMLFNGQDVSGMPKPQRTEYRKSVQMVHQDSYAALNPTKTIRQSLLAPLLQNKIVGTRKEAHKRIRELLETVELTPAELYLDKFPHQLSGGQRQRVLIARAISLQPRLIVADEPISMIDVSLRIAILNLMNKLNKELGVAFLYITHDLATARYLANEGKVVVMYLGEVVEYGKVKDVLNGPEHPYLQALMTAVPIPDPALARSKPPAALRSFEMPSIADPPSGCRFHPRCPYAQGQCEAEPPALREEEGRMIACHFAGQIPAWSLKDPAANRTKGEDEREREQV